MAGREISCDSLFISYVIAQGFRHENLKRLLEVALGAGELSRQLCPTLTHRGNLLDRLLATV